MTAGERDLFTARQVAALAAPACAVGSYVVARDGKLGRIVAHLDKPGAMVTWWLVKWNKGGAISEVAEPLLEVRS